MIKRIFKGIFFAAAMAGLFFLLVWGFQCLWNHTIPEVFNLKEITYWQALSLMVIARILFGGHGFRWGSGGGKLFWRERMKMKMMHMSDAEKEEFKRKVRERCGGN